MLKKISRKEFIKILLFIKNNEGSFLVTSIDMVYDLKLKQFSIDEDKISIIVEDFYDIDEIDNEKKKIESKLYEWDFNIDYFYYDEEDDILVYVEGNDPDNIEWYNNLK